MKIKDVVFGPLQLDKVKDNVSDQHPLESEIGSMIHGVVSAAINNRFDVFVEQMNKLNLWAFLHCILIVNIS